MKLKGFLLSLHLLFSVNAFAAFKDTGNVKVEFISVWSSNGDVLVQTSPKHDITGMGCTDNYWLVLNKSEGGFEPTLALLLSAQASGASIVARYDDENGGKFCRLGRVITKPPGR